MSSFIGFTLLLLALVFVLWPRPRSAPRSGRRSKRKKTVVVTAQDIARHGPITTQAAACKAFAELLSKARYFNGDRFMNAEAKRGFQDGLKYHLEELASTIEAFDDEIKKERDGHNDLLREDGVGEDVRPLPARVQKMVRVCDRLKAEMKGLRSDMTCLVVAYADHVLNSAPDPLIRQRNENPYTMK